MIEKKYYGESKVYLGEGWYNVKELIEELQLRLVKEREALERSARTIDNPPAPDV